MNHIAAETCLRPEKHYIADMNFIYRQAKITGDTTSIGISLTSLSREYQKLGVFLAALKYARRAVAILSKNAGSAPFHYALVHRCHVFCQLQSFAEAKLDAELAVCCSFEDVHAELALIRAEFPILDNALKLTPTKNSKSEVFPSSSITERIGESRAGRMTRLEQRLIQLVGERSRTKADLARELYGNRLSASVIENRLGNLLSRIRAKHPGLIAYVEGRYCLSEAPFLDGDDKLGSAS